MMLNVAMLSFWHVHADDYARQISSIEGCRIAAVWDELPERGRQKADRYGAPFYESLAEVLASPDIDAVIVDTPTNMHPDVMIQAARAGKHIFTEKVLALTVREADEIIAAVQEAGVKFMISLPRLTEQPWLYVKQAIDDGLIGTVTHLRARWSHNGAVANWLPPHFYDPVACGGGVLIDVGAHPMYLLDWFLGRPAAITARLSEVAGKGVDDNAVVILEYEGGAMATVETSFVATNCPVTVEVTGTEGTIFAGFPGHSVQIASTKLGQGWLAPNLPPAAPTPMRQWVEMIRSDKAPAITIEAGRRLTELMEAAYISAREGRTVRL